MGKHFERAQLLVEQGRFELAEQQLRQELANAPDDPITHALLAICLSEQNRSRDALQEAQAAIGLGPHLSYNHYVLASIFYEQKNYQQAETALKTAIDIDPEEPDYFTLLSAIKHDQKHWQEALKFAEQALWIDPEHVNAANLRAMSLVKLGREDEAVQAIGSALRRDPQNAVSHANQGWTLLHQGKHQKAMEHFREALRLDPQLEWAREGIIEALKARHLVYRLMLKYIFWMSKLSNRAAWAFIVGAYIGNRVLIGIADAQPKLAPFLWPLRIFYIVFVLLTWMADPLFNLLLRLNKTGRLALSRSQVVASNWVGGSLFLALLFTTVYFITSNTFALFAALGSGLFAIPVSGVFKFRPGKSKRILIIYTALLAFLGLTSIGLLIVESEAGFFFGALYLLGIFLYSWLTNYLIMKE
ncbi:MAG: tetratricopeptide repeat protein [bacterium]